MSAHKGWEAKMPKELVPMRLKNSLLEASEIDEIKSGLRQIKGRNIDKKVRAFARKMRRPVDLVRRIGRDY